MKEGTRPARDPLVANRIPNLSNSTELEAVGKRLPFSLIPGQKPSVKHGDPERHDRSANL